MAAYDLTLSRDAIPALLDQPAALGKLVETILNQVLEAQMRDHLGAERYERCEEREAIGMGIAIVSSRPASDHWCRAFHKSAMAASRPPSSSVIAAANKHSSWA